MNAEDTGATGMPTRRQFLETAAAAALLVGGGVIGASAAERESTNPGAKVPWYRRTYRWGQTNITEIDPTRYDIAWWRQHWRRIETQGVIINAGGIFAYYPSKFPLHQRAKFLGDRDLFGELCKAAHEDGLAVLARMDSSRASEAIYQAHPDWFTADAAGKPYRDSGLYVCCVNGPYFEHYIPDVLREIVERSHPEGFADNSWSGLGRGSFCYCANCTARFSERTGKPLPKHHDWTDPVYREWIRWNYARRLEIWDLFNGVTKAAGGPHCLWIGMNHGSVGGQSVSFRDYKGICERAEMILLDHQSRSTTGGFQHNGEMGKLVHGILGWDKLIPESMALYQAGGPTFRLASKPEPEARMWMLDGFAGGIQPWWHHLGAYHEDRRMLRTAEPILQWHQANEEFLVNRQPLATVGVLWSQQNMDFYGQDNAGELVDNPFYGMLQALLQARIPYLPIHADYIDRDTADMALLILPNLGAMSKSQVAAVRRFVKRGGGLLATGESSLYDEWGDRHDDFALADLFGAHLRNAPSQAADAARRKRIGQTQHTYLRLTPELRARVYGPMIGDEPAVVGQRHPVFRGFDETDILPFGGLLDPLVVDDKASVLMTFIPPFPAYPAETAWMQQPRTNVPGLIVNDSGAGRVAFLPADLDRRFARDNLPDHGNLLANLARWTAKDNLPLVVEGPGLIDCHLYTQPGRIILHLVNLTSAGTWRAPVSELIAVGPVRVKVRAPAGVHPQKLRLLVSHEESHASLNDGWFRFEIASLLDHEVAVFM